MKFFYISIFFLLLSFTSTSQTHAVSVDLSNINAVAVAAHIENTCHATVEKVMKNITYTEVKTYKKRNNYLVSLDGINWFNYVPVVGDTLILYNQKPFFVSNKKMLLKKNSKGSATNHRVQQKAKKVRPQKSPEEKMIQNQKIEHLASRAIPILTEVATRVIYKQGY